MISDEDLVNAYLNGDDCFGILIQRYRQALVNFICFNYVHDYSSAEDIAQETFLRAYLKIKQFDPTKKFKTWLYKIAINLCKTSFRKESFEDLSAVELLSFFDPVESLETNLQSDALSKALQILPPDKLLLLNLYYQQGYDFNEISLKLKQPIYLVKNRLQVAKRLLMQAYHIAN